VDVTEEARLLEQVCAVVMRPARRLLQSLQVEGQLTAPDLLHRQLAVALAQVGLAAAAGEQDGQDEQASHPDQPALHLSSWRRGGDAMLAGSPIRCNTGRKRRSRAM